MTDTLPLAEVQDNTPVPPATTALAPRVGLAPESTSVFRDPGARTGAATAIERAPVRMGLAPTNLDEGWRLAQMFAKSELVPKNFRNKPEDVLVAIQMGVEIGFAPMQALQSIAVINGRPSVWGDGFLALIMASPLYQDHDEFFEVGKQERRDGLTDSDLGDLATVAVCTFWRIGKPLPVTRRFSVAQARKAGLLGATAAGSKEGPWRQYPDRMLMFRARSWAGRDTFPDLLRGIRTAEEALDEPVPVIADTRMVTRMSAMAAATVGDHIHWCRGGHEYACSERDCMAVRPRDCAEHGAGL